jgi:hypothetical protein
MAVSRNTDLATLRADVQQLRGDLARMTSDLRNTAANRYSQAGRSRNGRSSRRWRRCDRAPPRRAHICAARLVKGHMIRVGAVGWPHQRHAWRRRRLGQGVHVAPPRRLRAGQNRP